MLDKRKLLINIFVIKFGFGLEDYEELLAYSDFDGFHPSTLVIG